MESAQKTDCIIGKNACMTPLSGMTMGLLEAHTHDSGRMVDTAAADLPTELPSDGVIKKVTLGAIRLEAAHNSGSSLRLWDEVRQVYLMLNQYKGGEGTLRVTLLKAFDGDPWIRASCSGPSKESRVFANGPAELPAPFPIGGVVKKVDRFPFRVHVGDWCKKYCNPGDLKEFESWIAAPATRERLPTATLTTGSSDNLIGNRLAGSHLVSFEAKHLDELHRTGVYLNCWDKMMQSTGTLTIKADKFNQLGGDVAVKTTVLKPFDAAPWIDLTDALQYACNLLNTYKGSQRTDRTVVLAVGKGAATEVVSALSRL